MTEEEIFLAVLELAHPVERTAYLEKACGKDTEFRRHVEELLAAHFKSGAFLDEPLAEQLATDWATPSNDNTVDLHAERRGDVVTDGKKPHEEPNDLHFLQPSSRPDSLGRIGHYEVLQVLGKGGFGIVLRAFDETLQRVVALKVLAPAIAATSPARKRFLREARSSAQVRHEHVVQVHAVEEQPLPYLVMEFIPGETLQQRLDRVGPLETPEIVRIGRQIAEGLAAAHASDLVHRDIKPGNVLLEGGQGRVKITDFGLARAADDASLTQSGVLSGTPMYMAPEQAKGESLDHRADLFSLGSVMYVMASGRPPFRASTTFGVLKRVAEDSPRPIREVIPEVPQWLCDIIARLHAKSPEERFQSAREVADLLADCEAKLRRDAKVNDFYRVPQSRPARGPSGKWKWFAAAALLLPILALALTESAGLTHLFRDREAKPDANLPAGGPSPNAKVDGPKKDDSPAKVDPPKQTAPWTVLKPIEMKSEGGATLTLQDDRSVLVSGNHPDSDVYTLTFRELPTRIHSLRLEALTHDSLPNKGPGRHPNPNLPFVLTTIKAELDHPKGPPVTLKLARAWGDYEPDDARASLAIDADDNTGWAAEFGQAHYAVFEFEILALAAEGAVLRVTLEFKHENPQRELGCFRLSAAKDKPAQTRPAALEAK
ncbi:MAG: serine/threonine protein kinase [Gemmataceae bacterium]|nr:serine/threonine protein kinase [Gemmataceae bacterium]